MPYGKSRKYLPTGTVAVGHFMLLNKGLLLITVLITVRCPLSLEASAGYLLLGLYGARGRQAIPFLCLCRIAEPQVR